MNSSVSLRLVDLQSASFAVVEPRLQARPHEAFHLGRHLRIVQPLLCLPLELRLAEKDRQHGHEPLADVLGSDVKSLDLDVVRLDVVADRFRHAALESVLVRAARGGGDAVGKRADRLRR
jgi:hypothetical protein